MLEYKIRHSDDVTIIDLKGPITLGEALAHGQESGRMTTDGPRPMVVGEIVRQILKQGGRKILLNLTNVTYIDSSGIGELVSAFTTVRNQGGELKLLNLTKKVHDLLQITKLYTVFDVKDDEATAVAAFK